MRSRGRSNSRSAVRRGTVGRLAPPVALVAAVVLAVGSVATVQSAAQSPGSPLAVLLGGEGTSTRTPDHNAFSHPMANLTFADRATFNIGNAVFRRAWVIAPSSTASGDGLGPLYNARACQHCHLKDGRGHPPEANFPDDTLLSMLVRLSVPGEAAGDAPLPEPVYGGQLQDLAIPGLAPEGHLWTEWTDIPVELAGGETATLRQPSYSIVDLGYGPISPDVMLSVRVAPPMIGLGLLEAIPEEAILANADPDDADGDGISGRPNWVESPSLGEVALGRFGWKANVATLIDQNSGAFNGDIGMSTALVPASFGDCTEAQAACRAAPHGAADGEVEVDTQLTNFLLFYTRTLAVPVRRDADDPEVVHGSDVFADLGCTGCHQPTFRTGADAALPALSDQEIWPYTDLLLHDMGEGLADHRPDGEATGSEWRTAPLWGIGLTEVVSGHTYFLHDGRARTLTEAVLWHGGEAQAARDGFAGLAPEDRAALLRFLESL
ncbi:MAG: thiol oxidoreductase [Rhodospirillaceae bacterium]|nr:thiol oxidoreductase [Rhodospirillaceae bacterium]MCA8932607.1 thiol oxidoreductase [Rhodospirillaceae bacterium]